MEPDIIVIGAGSAGCAVAARLAQAGKRVALVEAGKAAKDMRTRVPALMARLVQNPDFDWCYFAEPDPSVGGRPDPWPAGKRLGGGSAINGMMFIRGHRWDYDNWAKLGATGWDHAACLPYFRRIEDNERGADEWRGTGGPVGVCEPRSKYAVTDRWIEAAQQAGYDRRDLNGERAEGVDTIQLSQRRGLRSSSTGFLDLPGASANLTILAEAEVQKIVVENGRAVGVTFRRGGTLQTLRAKDGVVLSAGALNTPRLLMLSGIGPADHLREVGVETVHDLPGVGGNLQDHCAVHLVNAVDAHTLNNDAHGLSAPLQVLKLALAGTGALTTGIGHAQAFVHGRPGLSAPNLQLAFSAFSFEITPQGNVVLRPESSVATLVGLMRPSHRGRITLRSPDAADPPKIEHRLLGNEDDVEQLVEGLALARGLMRQPAMASLVTAENRPGPELETPEQLRSYVQAATISMFHPVGTARMGAADDPQAVVDPDLALRGIAGLWIADASVMPAIPQGNTNATAIMIGDKAADHILPATARN